MRRVATGRNLTQMVNLVAQRDRPDEQLIDDPMHRKHAAATPTGSNAPVALAAGSSPEPAAARTGLVHARPEPILK
jgi:hypothetical protein